jgi:hypothetical protein
MTTEKIVFKDRRGVQTKDILRTVSNPDQEWIKTVMLGYLVLESADPRPEFKTWFNQANDRLPKQPQHNNQHNTPKSFAQGIIDKLAQPLNRRDLSPKQCQGIEELSNMLSEIFELPQIKFVEAHMKSTANTQFGVLFKR